MLPAATGNIGKPGAGFYYLNGGRHGIESGYIEAPQLRPAPAKSLSHMDLAARLEDPALFQALFCWNSIWNNQRFISYG